MSWIESNIWYSILEVSNTVAVILCTWFFLGHAESDKIKSAKKNVPAIFLYGLIYICLTFLLADNKYGTPVLCIVTIAATMLIGHFLYNGRRVYLFYYFLYPVSILAAQVLTYYAVLGYSQARWGTFVFDYYTANVALVIMQLFAILLTAVWTVLLSRKKYRDIPGRHFAGLFIPPVLSAFVIGSLIVLGNVYMEMYGALLIVINILFLVVMNVYILYLFSYLSKNQELKNELELARSQSEMQYEYYQNIERKYQTSRTLVHDMRNHLQAMEALWDGKDIGSAAEYAKDIHQILDTLGRAVYTDNRMLNIILNDKAEQAKAGGIQMDIQIGELHLDQIRDMDITTIFSNLLDNALEAAGKAGSEKYIEIRAAHFHDFIVIKIQNSIGDTPYNDGHITLDDEKFKHRHMGIGLDNVRMALSKYGGGMQIEKSEESYRVSVSIPIAENEEDKR